MNLNWRRPTSADRPAREAIQTEMNARVGKDLELPDLDGKSIYLTMLAEDQSGNVLGAFMLELIGELKFLATDPRFTAAAQRDWWEPLCFAAKYGEHKLRFIHCPVPKVSPDADQQSRAANERIHEALEEIGMYLSGNDFFVKDLRG